MARRRQRAQEHGQSIREEGRAILRNGVKAGAGVAAPLGTRLRDRFARIGLPKDVAELRGYGARAAFLKR